MTNPAGQPAALRVASQRKADTAHRRATEALTRLRKAKKPITFASIAREAGVSQRYLYSHPDLADQIRKLRPSLARQPMPEPTADEPGIVSVLRAKITDQQRQIAELRDQIRKLENDLAAALGEVIKIRRQR